MCIANTELRRWYSYIAVAAAFSHGRGKALGFGGVDVLTALVQNSDLALQRASTENRSHAQ
jgi:hypothetical protein